MDKRKLFEAYCGMSCPYGETGSGVCPHCDKTGRCTLNRPWEDCEEFIDAHAGLIAEMDEDEGYRGEEEDESNDDW